MSTSQLVLTALGPDRSGIVDTISKYIFKHEGNIEAMETESYKAPITGSQLFRFEAVISIPVSKPISDLRNEQQSLAEENNFDMRMETLTLDKFV